MPWTTEARIKYLVSLPWTVSVSVDDDGDVNAAVKELPFLLATGRTEKEASRDLYDGLWSALEALMEHGDRIPLPSGTYFPWERGEEPAVVPQLQLSTGRLGGDAWSPTASAVAQSLALSA